MNKKEITCPWYEFLLNISYPTSGLVQCIINRASEEDLSTETLGFLHWDSLVGEVKNGGLGQYFFNRAQRGAPLAGMDEDMATHPLLKNATEIMKEVLSTYGEHGGDLEAARKTGDWPDEYFDMVSAKYGAIESKILEEDIRISPAINREILSAPDNYLNLVVNGEHIARNFTGEIQLTSGEDEYLDGGKLNFREGYPYGPNIIQASGREYTTTISPNRSAFTTTTRYYDEKKSGLSNRYIEETRDFLLNRSSYKKYAENGVMTEARNHTIEPYARISDQWSFYTTGEVSDHQFYSRPMDETNKDGSVSKKDQLLSTHSYCLDGTIFSAGHYDISSTGLQKIYWPNGQLNSIRDMKESVYVEVYDEEGKSLLDDDRSGEIQVIFLHPKTGEPRRRYGDIVNGKLVGDWRAKPADYIPSAEEQKKLDEIRNKVEQMYDAGNFPPHYRPKVDSTPIADDWTIVCNDDDYRVVMRDGRRTRVFTTANNLDDCLYAILKYIAEVMAVESAQANPSETETESEMSKRIQLEILTSINPEWATRLKSASGSL